MRLLCIGDSNTYGYEPGAFFGSRYPEEVRWADRLEGWDVINCGINGMSIPRDHSAYAALIRQQEPDLVFVMLGSNDILGGADAAQAAERMGAFLEALLEEGKPILVVAPTHMTFGDWVQNQAQIDASCQLGAMYRRLAEEKGCLFADAGEWGIQLSFDGVHFTPDGHGTFARMMKGVLETVCRGTGTHHFGEDL